jgi:hypothetical protein
LELRWKARATDANVSTQVRLRFNGDTASNYDWWYAQIISGVGYGVNQLLATTGARIGTIPAATATANEAGSGKLEIEDYARSTFIKTAHGQSVEMSGTGASAQIGQQNFIHWRSTAAITSIVLTDESGGNFLAGSRFDLYGVI